MTRLADGGTTPWRDLKGLDGLGTAGNLTTDAHLATLAIERGYTLCTTDTDFGRFRGLKWMNPLSSF
jgi:predicted nucleic acid-binding protein